MQFVCSVTVLTRPFKAVRRRFCATMHQVGSVWAATLRESTCDVKQLNLPRNSLLILGDAAGKMLELQQLRL